MRPILTLLLLLSVWEIGRSDNIWKVYHAGATGLPGDIVTALACDSLGNIWIGTDGKGTGMFNGAEWVSYRGGEAQVESIVSSITISPAGDAFIGYNGGGGVGAVIHKTFSKFTKKDVELPANNVQDVACDIRGNLWVATTRGLATRSHEGTWRIERDLDLPSKEIAAIAVDRLGHPWMSFLEKKGLAYYNGNSVVYYTSENSTFPDTRVLDLDVAADGTVWAATEESGLVQFDKVTATKYTTDNCGIPGNKVYSIALAPGGKMWVGTGSGAGYFDGQHWTAFTQENSPLPSNTVFSVTYDQKGRGWFGTQDGMARVTVGD